MFNQNSAIDNPTAMRYVVGEENPFNAWWSEEELSSSESVRSLVRGDKFVLDGQTLFVIGKWLEPGIMVAQNEMSPVPFELDVNGSKMVTLVATRSEREARKLV